MQKPNGFYSSPLEFLEKDSLESEGLKRGESKEEVEDSFESGESSKPLKLFFDQDSIEEFLDAWAETILWAQLNDTWTQGKFEEVDEGVLCIQAEIFVDFIEISGVSCEEVEGEKLCRSKENNLFIVPMDSNDNCDLSAPFSLSEFQRLDASFTQLLQIGLYYKLDSQSFSLSISSPSTSLNLSFCSILSSELFLVVSSGTIALLALSFFFCFVKFLVSRRRINRAPLENANNYKEAPSTMKPNTNLSFACTGELQSIPSLTKIRGINTSRTLSPVPKRFELESHDECITHEPIQEAPAKILAIPESLNSSSHVTNGSSDFHSIDRAESDGRDRPVFVLALRKEKPEPSTNNLSISIGGTTKSRRRSLSSLLDQSNNGQQVNERKEDGEIVLFRRKTKKSARNSLKESQANRLRLISFKRAEESVGKNDLEENQSPNAMSLEKNNQPKPKRL